MVRYLKAAFFARPQIAGLGRMPLNIVALAALGLLGVVIPGVWLLGLGLETAYLFGLATNVRFQRLVDATERAPVIKNANTGREKLVAQLTAEDRERLDALESKCWRILEFYREHDDVALIAESNEEALGRLKWLYLKLLIAQHQLSSGDTDSEIEANERQIKALEAVLSEGDLSVATRESKSMTLKILRKRREVLARKEDSVEEIGSDLTRLEAQIDLILDNAKLAHKPEAISINLELATPLLDASFYGDSSDEIANLDERFDKPRITSRRQRTNHR